MNKRDNKKSDNMHNRAYIAFALVISGFVFFALGAILNNIYILLSSIPYGIIVVIIILIKIYPASMIKEHMRQWVNTRSVKGRFALTERIPDYSKYKGVTKTYTRNKPIYMILLLIVSSASLAVIIQYGNYTLEYISSMLICFFTSLYQIYLLIFETITISLEGIGCKHWLKNYFIRWEEIKTAGFTLGQGGVPERPFGSVYVTKKILPKDMYGISKGDIKQGFIFFHYRPKLVHHLMAYYQKTIRNIEMVDSWKKYVRKNCVKKYI